jgi:peroxidase
LFELNLERKGYYSGFDKRVNPAIANSFGTAAFRFGHSLVQNSFVRFDTQHRPIFNSNYSSTR